MKRFLFAAGLGFVLLAAPQAFAQTGTARGKVLDEQGQPLADAQVVIEYQGGVTRKVETKSNKKGEYTQVGLTPGVYRFTASKEGFQSGYIEQRVNLGDATMLPDMKLRTVDAARKAAAAAGDAGALQASFRAAAELLQQGKLDEAEAAFKELQAKNPSIAEVPYNLGIIANRRKDWPAAEAFFKRAIELKPDFGDAYASLAGVYQAMGQPQKAEEVMQAAGEAMGGDPNVLFNQAVLLLNQGKYAEAEAAFKKVEAADAKNLEVQYHLATIALNLGRTDECVSRLEKYIASNPTNAQNLQTAQGLLAALKPKK
jgi:tetratricopeptide (TPR) repeat protein